MKYEIASKNIDFNGKDYKSYFKRIEAACTELGIDFFVCGAFARDVIIEHIYNEKTGVGTKDIDVAVEVHIWEDYERFRQLLIEKHGFQTSPFFHQLTSPEYISTDIIPFGGLEKNRAVSFPPKFNQVMNMMGFEEVKEATLEVSLDGDLALKFVSIEGLVLLKLIAWYDRQPEAISEKHVMDIRTIVNIYFDHKVEEFAFEYATLFDITPFVREFCSAYVIGSRLSTLSNMSPDLKTKLIEIFDEILRDEDNSLFIRQMLGDGSFRDYNFCLGVMKSMKEGFESEK